jgi:uncharacterized membrane protein YsdA (DUF1294 family)
MDKKNAQNGSSRIPERELHLLELRGGWIGSFFAQKKYKHKTKKSSYQRSFWLVLFFHISICAKVIFFRSINVFTVVPAMFFVMTILSMNLARVENRMSRPALGQYDEEFS